MSEIYLRFGSIDLRFQRCFRGCPRDCAADSVEPVAHKGVTLQQLSCLLGGQLRAIRLLRELLLVTPQVGR